MTDHVLFDEVHVSVFVPRLIDKVQSERVGRTLNSRRFRAELNRAIRNQDLLMKPNGEAIRSPRNRLSKLLVATADSLECAIETIRRQGYKLNLEVHQVMLLRDDGTGHLVSEGASRALA